MAMPINPHLRDLGCNADPDYKPPLLMRDYDRDPNITVGPLEGAERRGVMNHGSTLGSRARRF